MGGRKYGLMLLFCLFVAGLRAQTVDYKTVDSTAELLYNAGNWRQLVTTGNGAVKSGIDFPSLRMRLGYAQFMLGNYGQALYEYNKVLQGDAFNQTARFYRALCYKYLNQDLLAAGQAAYLDTASRKQFKTGNFGLVSAGLEGSFKIAGDDYRGNAIYTRVGISNMLFKNLQLDQSFAYFGQYIYTISRHKVIENDDRQTEYFAKLSYALHDGVILIGGWHYLYTTYEKGIFYSNVFIAGLNLTGTYVDVQSDVDIGHVITDHITQYNATLNVKPLGNLNLYFISRESYLVQNGKGIEVFSQLAGFKAIKNAWLESSVTFGKLSEYVDNDGLYIYNSIDDTKFKFGETLYYQLNVHAMLQLNYIFEKKQEDLKTTTYNQNSITAGLVWKF